MILHIIIREHDSQLVLIVRLILLAFQICFLLFIYKQWRANRKMIIDLQQQAKIELRKMPTAKLKEIADLPKYKSIRKVIDEVLEERLIQNN